MKRQILIGLIFLLSVTMSAQTNNNKYEKGWKQVEEFDTQSLPQSAMKQADEILQKAIADKNNTQVIKALIYRNKYKKNIDRNDNVGLFSDLQGLLSRTDDIAEKALLHSMLAELYADYYQNNQWQIRQRTALSDVVPEDMKEWPANIFMDKVTENLDLSVKDAQTLKTYTTKQYDDIINIGTDGQKYYPTLYDFLALRTIGVSQMAGNISYYNFDLSATGIEAKEFFTPAEDYVKLNIKADINKQMSILRYYQAYSADLLKRNLIPTIILTDIDRIQYLGQKSQSFTKENITGAYESLYNKYENNEASIEIITKIADSYTYSSHGLRLIGIAPGKYSMNEEIYDWLNKGIQKYPDYPATNVLRNKLADLTNPNLNIKSKPVTHSQQAVKLDIVHKNIQALEKSPVFKLYRIEKDEYKEIKDYSLNLVSKTTYDYDTLSVDLGKLPVGRYCFTDLPEDELDSDDFNKNNNNNKVDFIISNLITFSRNSKKDEFEIFVVDRMSGKPVKNAAVKIYEFNRNNQNRKSSGDLLTTLKTDELGLALYKHEKTNDEYSYYTSTYKIELGADSCLNAEYLEGNNYQWRDRSNTSDDEFISIFTDRSIYRPGQTVYFKAIILDNGSKPKAKEEYTVELYNTNNDHVEEVELTTNEFGSIAGNFVLPKTGLLGQYSIEIDDASVYFSVEEYKRPTFEITFDKVAKTYTFGEEVKLKGYAKNFSGISLQDADVQYSISREQYNFWWGGGNQSQFADGNVKTNADGSFEIIFTPEAGDNNQPLIRPLANKQIYRFNITATVTDVNGETQSNNFNLVVGNVSMVINIDMPEKIEKSDKDTIKIEARNLQGDIIETSGTYTIEPVYEEGTIVVTSAAPRSHTFKTGEQTDFSSRLKTLQSGKYKLKVKAFDDKKNEIEEEKEFIIYSYSDKKPPIKTDKWVVQKNVVFDENKPAEVIFGTSKKDVNVLYQLSNDKQVFERRIVKLSDANQLFKVPYKAEYGNMLNMTFTYVKDEQLYNENVSLFKKTEEVADTDLKIKLESFRDKLRPGQEETWTISVKDSRDNPASAEILASMYDISLDKIRPYMAWQLNRPYIYTDYLYAVQYRLPWQGASYPVNFDLDYNTKYEKVLARTNDVINWFGYMNNSYRNNILGGKINPSKYDSFDSEILEEAVVVGYGTQIKSSVTGAVHQVAIRGAASMDNALAGRVPGIAVAEDAVLNEVATDRKADGMAKQEEPTPQIRQNFNETAFFYPQLRTNETGETLISFTVPESNTTWRFRALAHDKDAKAGMLEQLVVTRKELMVTPNMPRFVRQGDKTSISTKISNLSDNAVTGNVRIEFFDPATDKTIDLNIANQKQTFSIAKDASSSANWTFDIPSGMELIGCRIVAESETFSDGEQHVLAVLPNRMLVTESMPIGITDKGTHTFTLDKLYNNKSATSDNYKLTLEYASNPAWYAVQALPTMSNPANENAINWFASYYVNTLGSSITRQYPKVSAMIQAWTKQGGDKQTLVSKLQKNEELKAVLLEETPWVLEAKNETDQMQRLSLLFDLNNTSQLTSAATQKLSDLMTSEGGWSWYKGFYPSRSITQYILYGYANLQRVGQVQYPEEIKMMQMKALKYIDSEILKDFNSLKKNNKNWEKSTYVSTNQIEYAYVRSFYRDIPIDQETRAAERFYTDVAAKNWTKLGMYERSILSVILKRNGDKALADKIVKSIKEHAVNDKKLGMYWPNNTSNVFMSLSAISTHTFLMDALHENGASEKEMNAMKRWLLMQKQTQIWESTHATIDAISALLSTGSDWFTTETTTADITIGDKKVEPENKELGTGYFKKAWDKGEITNNMAKVSVTTAETDPAYGALYWQYFEDLDKITSQKGDLNVEKQLFKENVSSSGAGLALVTENNPLSVGDKVVVRLTVRVNRDMEFVQLKDMRAPCFEPIQTLSGTKWADRLLYYQMPKDASTNFYFDHLPKGTYVLEYPVYVNRSGEYSNGITTIQCLYAPQYVSHTQGIKVTVKDKE